MIKFLGMGFKQPPPLLLAAVAGPAVDRLAALVRREYARHWNRRASLETARASGLEHVMPGGAVMALPAVCVFAQDKPVQVEVIPKSLIYPRIRYGTLADVEPARRIAVRHSRMVGFVRRNEILRGIENRELLVAEIDGLIAGFVNWHARRDGWSTVYALAVDSAYQGQGIGRALLYAVPCPMRLKCMANNPANSFYRNAGMGLVGAEKGRKYALNIYEMRVLTCIVRGGKPAIPGIARQTGCAYGVHHHDKPYSWPFMVDSDPEHCDWRAVMDAVNKYHPVQTLTADYFPGQREMMLAQVADLRAAGVLRIAVCPKFHSAVADIPADCIVAISLKTNGKLAKGANKYAGFMPDFVELTGRRVHLLGGSPALQKKALVELQGIGVQVISVDGNAHIGSADKGSQWDSGKWRRKNGEPVNAYRSQVISSMNIRRELNAAASYMQPALFAFAAP